LHRLRVVTPGVRPTHLVGEVRGHHWLCDTRDGVRRVGGIGAQVPAVAPRVSLSRLLSGV